MKILLIIAIAGARFAAFAQSSPIIASAGYSSPEPLQAAPGQVVTLFVRDVPRTADGQLRSGKASGLPLSNALAGLSVAIIQASGTLRAPIFAVRQESECDAAGADEASCLLTAIQIQVPYDLAADISLSPLKRVIYGPLAQVRIDVDGRSGRPFALQPLPDNAHVLTSCDASWNTSAGVECQRSVYHTDGTVADENAPARPGETVVVYAYGLGPTNANAVAGIAAASAAPVTDLLGAPRLVAALQKDFVNALSSTPRRFADSRTLGDVIPIAFAGLLPGGVGVYQVNITLPQDLTSYPCGGEAHSNAVLNLSSLQGTESIALCVQQ
jgi:hypothetical protein